MKNFGSRIFSKLKSEGVLSTLSAAYRIAVPSHLNSFPKIQHFFQGKLGLEIGGPSGAFSNRGLIPIYPIADRIDNCNFGAQTTWLNNISEGMNFRFSDRARPGRQYIAEASNLHQIDTSSYDFVLSSHCIEHLANPLAGLHEWSRVLRQHGALVLIVPHKDGTFDHRRPVTAMSHLIDDFEAKRGEDDMTHFDEILELHDLHKDPGAGTLESFRARSLRNAENRCFHHHVFDTRLAARMVDHVGLQILEIELVRPYHIVIIARRIPDVCKIENQPFLGIDSKQVWRSPFPTDRR